MDVKAAYVIGGGDQSVVKPMTAVSPVADGNLPCVCSC